MHRQLAEAVKDHPERAFFIKVFQDFSELELLDEDVAYVRAEPGQVVDEVRAKLACILLSQILEGELALIVDLPTCICHARKDRHAHLFVHLLGQVCCFVENGLLGAFENAVQTAQDREGQNDLSIFGLLEVTAQ